jgi:Methylase involved in ubiquinone/menaquinone biosynthesis
MFGPRHEYRVRMIVERASTLPSGSRILDGAVGLGQLANRLSSKGFRVFGVDYSLDAARHAKGTYAVPVVVGDMTRLPFRDGAFAGFTTGETLEHLPDDVSAASEIGRVLADGGTCIATVPALQSLWSRSDDYYEHLRRYSARQLTDLFERAGLSVRKASFWGFPIILVYDTLFLLPMNRRRASRDVEGDAALRSVARAGKSRWLVRLVLAVFAIDRLFSFVPFGPGLLLVAVKRGGGSAARPS